jgi:hypothetical protein
MTKWKDSKGRPVCDVEVSGYGDEAMIESAHYDDTPPGVTEEVPEDELNWMQEEFAAEVAELAFENAVGAAESYFEGDR